MASALSIRIASSRARRSSTAGTSTLADRIARSRQRRRGDPEEEEEERGFLDRLWFGKEKEGVFAPAPKIDQGRRTMGLEEVPGQFAEVAWSPIVKGLIPLARLASGAAKWGSPSMMDPARAARDPDVQMAATMVDEFGESLVELPKDIREGYPAEGIMNLALAMFPGLKGAQAVSKMAKLSPAVPRGLGTSARVAELVADPVQAAYVGTKEATRWAGRKYVKKPLEKVKQAVAGEEAGAIRGVLLESVVGFFTNLPALTARKMLDYGADTKLRDRMVKGRKDSEGAYARAQRALKNWARNKQAEASKDFGRAQASLDEVKIEGRPAPSASIVDIDIRSEKGKLFVDAIEDMLSQGTPDMPQGFGANLMVVIGTGKLQRTVPYAKIRDGIETIPEGATYNIRVKHGERATLPHEHRPKINAEIEGMLNRADGPLEYKGITVGVMMAKMDLFNKTIDSWTIEQRPSSALVARWREAQKKALQDPVAEAGGDLTFYDDYHRKQLELDQLKEDLGVHTLSPETVESAVNNKIGAAYEEVSKLNRLEEIIGPGLVAEVVGAQSKKWLGAGLHVKAEISGLIRGMGGVIVADFFGPVLAFPLLAFYSPRTTSALLSHLDKIPRIRKALTGRTDIPIPKGTVAKIVGQVRRMNEKLEKYGIDVRNLASKGMTLGQLMQRLQAEEQQQR